MDRIGSDSRLASEGFSVMMDTIANRNSAVIVRLDRTIRYAAAFVFNRSACDYWIPAFRGYDEEKRA
jgi:hypothetical protein